MCLIQHKGWYTSWKPGTVSWDVLKYYCLLKIAYCSNNNTWATSQLRSVCESHSRILDLQSSRRGKQDTGHNESPILNLIHPTTIQWVQASKACHVHTSTLSLMYLRASAVPISSSSGIVTKSNFSLGLQTLVKIWWNCVTAESSTIMIISEKESTCHQLHWIFKTTNLVAWGSMI